MRSFGILIYFTNSLKFASLFLLNSNEFKNDLTHVFPLLGYEANQIIININI